MVPPMKIVVRDMMNLLSYWGLWIHSPVQLAQRDVTNAMANSKGVQKVSS